MIDRLKAIIKRNDHIRKFILWSITPSNNPYPRFWIKWFINPFIHKKGQGSYHSKKKITY